MRVTHNIPSSFNEPFKIPRIKRFREDDITPKEIKPEEIDNHYGHKLSHFQGTPLGGTPSSNLCAAGIELVTLEKMNVTCQRRTQNKHKRVIKDIQVKIFRALERPCTTLAYLYHGFVFALIIGSLALSILITNKNYEKDRNVLNSVYYLEISLVLVFTLEYVLRIWSCSCHGNYKGIWGKMRFIKKPYMVIDIIVIVATTAVIATTKKEQSKADYFSVSLLRFLRFLQVLRVLRIDRQQGAFKMVSNVLYDHRQELLTCCYMTFILIVACSFLVYLAEKSDTDVNDNEMKDLSDGIYWGFITLSTIGYGDFAPQNTVAKWITVIFSFVGTAFFALPAGILGSGFAIQVAQNQKQKHINRRRHPAAVLIQYAWRNHVAHPYIDSTVTWRRHQIRTYSKENRYSIYTGNEPATPNSGRKSFAYLRKKFQSGRNSSFLDTEGYSRSRRSSIGATIPSALELRDRCQSEGNLLLVSPHNVDDNQATIVSLPQSVICGEFGGNPNMANSQDVHLRPLTEREKNVVRFIRKVKFEIAIRKFREQLRPYDIKDVLEQYSEGQMEMFSFMKRCQGRIECALGLKEAANKTNSLHSRLQAVERKMDTLDEKMDIVLQLLRKDTPTTPISSPTDLPLEASCAGYQYAYNSENPYDAQDGSGNPSIYVSDNKNPKELKTSHGMSIQEVDELSKRLQMVRDAEYNSLSGSRSVSETSINNAPLPEFERGLSRFTVTPSVIPGEEEKVRSCGNIEIDIKDQSVNFSRNSLNSKNSDLENLFRSNQNLANSNPSNSPMTNKSCKYGSLNSLNWNVNANNSNMDKAKVFRSVPVLSDLYKNICNGYPGGRVPETRNQCKNRTRCSKRIRDNGNERLKSRRTSLSSNDSTPTLTRLFSPFGETGSTSNSDVASLGNTMSVQELLGNDELQVANFFSSAIPTNINGTAVMIDTNDTVSNLENSQL